MSINTCTVAGRLVADPIERKTDKYTLAKFTLAVDRNYGKEKQTDFLDCDAWQKTAEYVLKYLKKGSPVAVSGRLQQDTWEKDGKKQSKIFIVADKVESFGKSDSVKDDNLDDGQIRIEDIAF